MRERVSIAVVTLLLSALGVTVTFSLAAQENRTLTVNGQSVAALIVDGHPSADLVALARAMNGSLAYSGNQITLNLPSQPVDSSSLSGSNGPTTPLSRAFLKAGIEAMSNVREWHSALANAIRNQYPLAENWLATYRNQAGTNLRLASTAASTDSDRNAMALLNAEFEKMKQLSDHYVAKRQNLSYIAPDSLQNDDLDKSIVACGHAIAAMIASGQFQDDGSCQ